METTKLDSAKKIWRQCFDDSPEYLDMYFSTVYRDDDCLTLERDGQTVSSLMLQPYSIRFHSRQDAPAGYVCGVGTLPHWRGQGCATELMHRSLHECYRRGYMFAMLIPADETLALYYHGMGFTPVFRADRHRYTSLHNFAAKEEYRPFYDFGSDEAYAFFARIMAGRPGGVQHTRHQYNCIIMDNSVDGGSQVGVTDGSGRVTGMAFVVTRHEVAVVTDLLAADNDAAEATLAQVRCLYPDQQVEVLAVPNPNVPRHDQRGMMRIVNVYDALGAIASAHPKLQRNIRVHDPIIADNNATFVMARGSVSRVVDSHKHDLDIGVDTLTSIVFGNRVTADILDFPTVQPFISLMLD